MAATGFSTPQTVLRDSFDNSVPGTSRTTAGKAAQTPLTSPLTDRFDVDFIGSAIARARQGIASPLGTLTGRLMVVNPTSEEREKAKQAQVILEVILDKVSIAERYYTDINTYVRFDRVTDGTKFFEYISEKLSHLVVPRYLTVEEWRATVKPSSLSKTTFPVRDEGIVFVKAVGPAHRTAMDMNIPLAGSIIFEFLSNHLRLDIQRPVHRATDDIGRPVFAVAFDSVGHANQLVALCKNGTEFPMSGSSYVFIATHNLDDQKIKTVCPVRLEESTPLRSTVRIQETLQGLARKTKEYSHNAVVRERIAKGIDVRTTIMLRNIPNRITKMQLKMMLDRYVSGHYDFMYLRIDFSNGCNVGYGFVNFDNSESLLTFYDAVNGIPWAYICQGVSSEKKVEISYAATQGQSALIEKFRNSSIMTEPYDHRPMLLYTPADGAQMPGRTWGSERPFPSANNHTKLQRSLNNAQTLGLYQNPRQGGSRQRMQGMFDNGSPRGLAGLSNSTLHCSTFF